MRSIKEKSEDNSSWWKKNGGAWLRFQCGMESAPHQLCTHGVMWYTLARAATGILGYRTLSSHSIPCWEEETLSLSSNRKIYMWFLWGCFALWFLHGRNCVSSRNLVSSDSHKSLNKYNNINRNTASWMKDNVVLRLEPDNIVPVRNRV